ncbi:MAG: hypothetical protein AAGF71_07570 [Pseudomonadota bacterium]
MASLIVSLAQYWIWAGLGVSFVFLAWGVDRVEPSARGAYTFRPLVIPGIVLLWPLVLWRWWQLETGRDVPHARHQPPIPAHRRVWLLLALVIPAILITGVMIRQDRDALAAAPVQLSEPVQ